MEIVSCLGKEEDQNSLILFRDENGLALKENDLIVRGDFTHMLPRIKTCNLRGELLVRAAKIKDGCTCPVAVDATAGLGEDSLLLAAMGYSVQLYEYNSVIASLLQDALERAKTIPELKEIVERMQLKQDNSICAMQMMKTPPDLILLDPMFPARQKSALVKKKFQLLQKLEQPCMEENDLIQAAFATQAHKIVVKRPAKGPTLAGIKPGYSIAGKGIRYDVYVT